MDERVREEVLKLALLSRRTEKQIIEKLLKKGFEENEIKEATAYYRQNGYIDHADFARRFAADCVNIKEYGPERIKQELLKRGVEENIADNALEGIEYDLPALIRKRFKSCVNAKERQKIINFFIRRGYTYYETADALKEVFE